MSKFEVRISSDNRRIATADTWSEAAAIHTYEQNFYGIPMYIVQQTLCPVHGTWTFTPDHSGGDCA